MSTPAKIAIGIFLTLMVLCQIGIFDPQFNAHFIGRALSDKDWLTRVLFPVIGPQNFIADVRNEDPLSFASMAMLPSAFFAITAYIFLAGLRAIVSSGERAPKIAEGQDPA